MAHDWLNFIRATKCHHGMHTCIKYHLINLQHVSFNTSHHKQTITDQNWYHPGLHQMTHSNSKIKNIHIMCIKFTAHIYPLPQQYHFTCTWIHHDDLYIPLAFAIHLDHKCLHDDDLYIPLALAIRPDPYLSPWWWSVYTLGLGNTSWPYVSPSWWYVYTVSMMICRYAWPQQYVLTISRKCVIPVVCVKLGEGM